MAPTLLVIALAFAISMQGTLGNMIACENLNEESCAYAVSSTGKRCVLEKRMITGGYTCATSEIVADKINNWIETEECISACGVEKKALGISSDSLLENKFAGSLCSEECYTKCPNIVDLYFNLAAGEGVYLPKFCQGRSNSNGRREMLTLFKSSGIHDLQAFSPTQSDHLASAPALSEELAATFFDGAPAPSPTFDF